MMCKMFVSALLILASLQDAGANASVTSITEEDMPDDKVTLLQSQVEVKKGEAKEAKQAAEVEEEEFSSGAGYASTTTCSTPEKVAEPVEALLEKEQGLAPSSKQLPDSDVTSLLTLGNLLQAMALLLVLDTLRRCPWKADESQCSSTNETHTDTKTVSCDASTFRATILAGDESAFDAQVDNCHSQLSQLDSWGCSVLHYAAKGGSSAIIERLVNLGSSVNALDAWDETPLHTAVRAGHMAAAETLLAAGALIDSPNAEDCTPLIVAGREEHEAMCRLLIGHGATADGLAEDLVPKLVREMLLEQNAQVA
jgi:hypothetical protein